MKVPEKIFSRWKELESHGDQAAICQQYGYSRPTISKAMSTGKCTEKIMTDISDFYRQKAGRLETMLLSMSEQPTA